MLERTIETMGGGGGGLGASKYATKHPENVEKNYYI
jgi:hypothetical protein